MGRPYGGLKCGEADGERRGSHDATHGLPKNPSPQHPIDYDRREPQPRPQDPSNKWREDCRVAFVPSYNTAYDKALTARPEPVQGKPSMLPPDRRAEAESIVMEALPGETRAAVPGIMDIVIAELGADATAGDIAGAAMGYLKHIPKPSDSVAETSSMPLAPWQGAGSDEMDGFRARPRLGEAEVLPPLDPVAEIRAGHEEYRAAWKKGCRGAIRAGIALQAKKDELGHGNLYRWIRANCPEVEQMASRYMRLARPENRERVLDMPVRAAIKYLAKPKAAPDEETTPDEVDEPDPEDIGHKNYAVGMRMGEAAGKADARAGAPRSPAAPANYPDSVGARGWSVGYDRGFDAVIAKLKTKPPPANEETDDDTPGSEPDNVEDEPEPKETEPPPDEVSDLITMPSSAADKPAVLPSPADEHRAKPSKSFCRGIAVATDGERLTIVDYWFKTEKAAYAYGRLVGEPFAALDARPVFDMNSWR
jgi:hypothetical protein